VESIRSLRQIEHPDALSHLPGRKNGERAAGKNQGKADLY
jgi:hypothetical protein